MSELNFTEDDKQKFIDFLNMTANKAEFKFNTTEVVGYFKLLAHMQQKIIPKIDANILEIRKIIEQKEQTKQE